MFEMMNTISHNENIIWVSFYISIKHPLKGSGNRKCMDLPKCLPVFTGVSPFGLLLLQRFSVGLLLRTHFASSQCWILIWMFAVFMHWWVEVLHADRTTFNLCLWTTAEPRARVVATSNWFKPPVIYYWPFQGGASVLVYSNCNRSLLFEFRLDIFLHHATHKIQDSKKCSYPSQRLPTFAYCLYPVKGDPCT